MRRFVTTAALATALSLAACSDPAPAEDPHVAAIAKLTEAIESLTEANETVGKELKRQARQIDGLRRDMAPARDTEPEGPAARAAGGGVEVEATGASAGMPGKVVADETGELVAVESLLTSESARKAIQKAAAKEVARREERQRRTFVSYTIGTFASKAGLDEHQTRQLQRIWKESLDGGVKLRAKFAAVRKLPEAQREQGRAEAMEQMRGLGRRRDEQIRDLLNQEQLELYAKAEKEIVDSLHGGPRRPSTDTSE